MDHAAYLRFIIAGQLSRDFVILPDGRAEIDVPGGSLLYAAAGLGLWDKNAGLIARVGEDYPQEWIERVAQKGFDVRGIHILPGTMDVRQFAAYDQELNRQTSQPISHFARLGLPFPQTLLGYEEPPAPIDSRTQPSENTIRLLDFPADYLDATAAHLCPLDFLTHTLLPPALRQGHVSTVTLDPAAGYMNPMFWDEIPLVVNGLTAFLTSEEKTSALFHGRSTDLWEMAEALGSYGCEFVVIKRGQRGQYLYDAARKIRWLVPAYPVNVKNPSGAGDAFCGGFLIGYRSTYDGLDACLYGNVAASFVVEGTGPYYAFDAFPALIDARLRALREMARKL